MKRLTGFVGVIFFAFICVAGLNSCGQGASGVSTGVQPQNDDAVLTFQASTETLRFPLLQAGTEVYEDVVLSLRQDSSWALKSVGQRKPLANAQVIDAELVTNTAQVLDTSWRPQSASIRIRRLHLDDRVFGNVTLRLEGNAWRWEAGMQNLQAFSMADFAANPRLTATDTDHVVLRSRPDVRSQQFPLRLQGRDYNFCFDRHDGPGDTFSLTDSSGGLVFRVKAGEPCASFRARAETYTFTHTYGNAGKVATLFLRPARAAAAPAAPRRDALRPQTFSLTDQVNYPEYWGIFALGNAQTPAGGYLSMNFYGYDGDPNGFSGPCYAFIDAAGQVAGYSRPGDSGTTQLWDTTDNAGLSFGLYPIPTTRGIRGTNLFLLNRDINGAPNAIGSSFGCRTWAEANWANDPLLFRNAVRFGGYPTPAQPLLTGQGAFVNLYVSGFQNQQFTIAARAFQSWDAPQETFSGFAAFSNGLSGFSAAGFFNNTQSAIDLPFLNLRSGLSPQNFRVDYRFFPNGLPPSQRNSDGTWMVGDEEIALFDGANCTGKAMLLAGDKRTTPAGGLAALFGRSMQLGARAAAVLQRTWGSTATDAGNYAIVNQSGCITSIAPPGNAWPVAQITVSASAMQIFVAYNECANCNLSGLQMTGTDSLRGVRLPNANLTGASFSNSDLTGADLRNATLQGAKLNNTNFEGANFCGANLNNTSAAGVTSLAGAHLKNVNFNSANLDGAILTYASFYSSNPGTCQPSDCTARSVSFCAKGPTSMNKADLTNAYLSGADFSSAQAKSANFSGAVLFGTQFNKANLSRADSSLPGANFSNSFLQGTDFTSAILDYAQFNNAYFDQDTQNACMQIALSNEYTGFRGFKTPDPNDSSGNTCITAPQAAPTCLQVSYTAILSRPGLNATSSCPDGTPGPCNSWQSRVLSSVPNSTCNAAQALCGSDPYLAPPPNKCW